MMKKNLVILFSLFCISAKAQTYKVLFIGNSYTHYNDLPQMVHDVALSVGDTLIFDSYSPGGYKLIDHSLDVTCQNKIKSNNWDFVVLQGQSQEPIMSSNDFSEGASALSQQIRKNNSCTVIMPYMTWGRKNGDAANCPNFPVMCTYESMDTTLRNIYLNLTRSVNGEVSPVSVVWKYIRQNHPGIELYNADESHPSIAGTYAAACCFYTMLFKNDPTWITFNSGLNANDASLIRNAVKVKVFDQLQRWDFKKLPIAGITYQAGSGTNEINFHAANNGVQQSYSWNFGDGSTTDIPTPVHSYSASGTYTVSLTTSNCDWRGVHTSYTDTVIQICDHTPTVYISRPWLCIADTLWTQPANAYQWLAYGVPIPETKQYLANYSRYATSGFSVISTINSCSELSKAFSEQVEWSGYYFDIMGNPCKGDTVAFAVLHINGFLSGSENILWYKNDTLLTSMINEDTLLIFSSGKYQCKVTNPNAQCPIDTTSYAIEYNCETVGVGKKDPELFWQVFPNPATESITIKSTKYFSHETIQIYNAMGILVRSINTTTTTTQININDLAEGLYHVRLKNNHQSVLKFVKM